MFPGLFLEPLAARIHQEAGDEHGRLYTNFSPSNATRNTPGEDRPREETRVADHVPRERCAAELNVRKLTETERARVTDRVTATEAGAFMFEIAMDNVNKAREMLLGLPASVYRDSF